jgi:hypothetical protein
VLLSLSGHNKGRRPVDCGRKLIELCHGELRAKTAVRHGIFLSKKRSLLWWRTNIRAQVQQYPKNKFALGTV